MAYTSPEWRDTGSIDLRPSQEGILGVVGSADFADWMLNGGGMENLAPGITYDAGQNVLTGEIPAGFSVDNQFTWYLILE